MAETFQSLPKAKPKKPKRENAGFASMYSRTKKYPIRTRIPAARPVSPHFSARSGSRLSGDRPRTERSPRTLSAPVSIRQAIGDPLQVMVPTSALALLSIAAGSGA